MIKYPHLAWSFVLGREENDPTLRLLWILPHDIRRNIIRTIFPKQYWKLLSFRQGSYRPYRYDSFEKLRTIYVHIPKAAGTFINGHIINSHTGHFTISDYQIMYGNNFFKSAFKFTFVRNPWDRLVSAFFYLTGDNCSAEDKKWANQYLSTYKCFEEFVLDLPKSKLFESWIHFIPQYRFICDPFGFIPLDFIGKLENIQRDIGIVCKNLNIDGVATLKKKNQSNHMHYANYYSEETANIVCNIYKRDIDLFSYSFSKTN